MQSLSFQSLSLLFNFCIYILLYKMETGLVSIYSVQSNYWITYVPVSLLGGEDTKKNVLLLSILSV